MFCSTIIPTVGRPSLSRAVQSVLDQTLDGDDFEVIVVNDSGEALPAADWQRSDRVKTITTHHRERSVARNTGAAIAQGRFMHFLDDDDWLLPGALSSFWELSRTSDAAWLYGSSQLVDRQDKPLIQLHHGLNGNCFVQVMAGEWIPLQASVVRADAFFSVGGFNPRLASSEDIDLCRRFALRGDLAYAPAVVVSIGMGTENSTTDYRRIAELSRWAREGTLDAPGAFARMRASAHSSEWYGRIVRIYLTSVIWNLQHRRLFSAISRAAYGFAGFCLAGPRLLTKNFWQSLATSYDSQTFIREYQISNRPVLRRTASQ